MKKLKSYIKTFEQFNQSGSEDLQRAGILDTDSIEETENTDSEQEQEQETPETEVVEDEIIVDDSEPVS